MSSRVTILGPGLLGGSLALALKTRTKARVVVWGRSEESIEKISRHRSVDMATTDLRAAVFGANAIVFATPIETMEVLAVRIENHVKPETLVMDVGSVKAGVVAALGSIFAGRARFIGCHPMAGSEQSGFAAARADLFDGSVCILTPNADTPPDALADAAVFWQSVGCTTRTLGPAEHDEIVAWISHFPHLLAAALVQTVAEHNAAAFDFAGPGFRDTTRIASGPPDMWTGILAQNRAAVRVALDGLIEKLRALSTVLNAPDAKRDFLIHQLLNQAKAQRDCLRLPRNSSDV